jgi:hypothetical protein
MSATYPSPSVLLKPISFLGRMRATSAGSCDAGASGGEFGGGGGGGGGGGHGD